MNVGQRLAEDCLALSLVERCGVLHLPEIQQLLLELGHLLQVALVVVHGGFPLSDSQTFFGLVVSTA